jgi:hypothetical protein
MTHNIVDFRNSTGRPLLDPDATQAIALLGARYEFTGAGLTVTVNGIVRGIASVDLTLRHSGGESEVDAVPEAETGLFSATFANLPVPIGETVLLEAASEDESVSDHATWRVDRQGPILAVGNTVGLPASRQGFVAGVPDRVLRSRFFTPMMVTTSPFEGYKTVAVYRGDGKAESIEVKALVQRTQKPLHDLIEGARDGEFSIDRYKSDRDAILGQALPVVVEKHDLKVGGRGFTKGTFLAALREHFKAVSAAKHVAPHYLTFDSKPPSLAYGPASSERWNLRWQDLFALLLGKELQELPVGVLFTDRLRFQPSGLVMGERIYALSLAPGEEVQLRQVVESKRQTVAEDIKDREAEQQLTLSSTWTTEITEVLRESQSRQSSSTLGLSGGADLTNLTGGFVPINVGGSASFSGSSASETSSELSQRQSREATATASARMRSQHRIRLEVTNETSSSMATTRTIRNANRQRSATLLFHKIYRKDRVSLERTDAQLCLRLLVRNPAAETRAAFIAGLKKIDPDEPANYNLMVPQSFSASWSVQLDHSDTADVNATGTNDEEGSGYNTATIATFNLSDKFGVGAPGDIPPNYGLAELPNLAIDSFYWGDKKKYGRSNFEEKGGEVGWTTVPTLWTADPMGALKTTMYWVKSKNKVKSIHNVNATFSAIWVPTGTDLAAYSLSRSQERSRLIEALDAAQIYTLRDIAMKSFPGQVLGEAAEEHFRGDANMADLAAIFDLNGLYMEVVPHWATKQGRTAYDSLYGRLERLPLLIAPSDILVPELTASLARVYLPVKAGMENQAIRLLESIPLNILEEVADDVQDVRDRDFPYYDRVLNTPEEICGPQPPAGTPIDAADWNSDWERPQRRFKVLAQWHEYIPTDGIHMETVLSDSVSTDEALTDAIIRNGS